MLRPSRKGKPSAHATVEMSNAASNRYAVFMMPNGERYRLVGETRGRHFGGISSKQKKVPENAQTPTSRVHAVLGGVWWKHFLRKYNLTAVSIEHLPIQCVSVIDKWIRHRDLVLFRVVKP